MKTTLMALAAAGFVASGAAVAAPGEDVTLLMHAQYQSDRWDDRRSDRWDDRWDDRNASVNEREQRMTDRIQRGMNDGRITDREARRLYSELNDIEAKERSFLYDGRLNRSETAELHRDLDNLRDNVRQQLRDRQRY